VDREGLGEKGGSTMILKKVSQVVVNQRIARYLFQ